MKELIFLEIKKVSEDDLKLINSFSKRELKADEIYTFRLVCCDNQIDRDFEKFDDSALEKMAELYSTYQRLQQMMGSLGDRRQ